MNTFDEFCSVFKRRANAVAFINGSPDFPKIKVGRQYIVPEDKFYAYMDTRCYKIIS